jgi:hypothetical protein
LCAEVASRLSAANARAKTITLKLKRKQQGAPEPAKFLGHGACDNLSRRCGRVCIASAHDSVLTCDSYTKLLKECIASGIALQGISCVGMLGVHQMDKVQALCWLHLDGGGG